MSLSRLSSLFMGALALASSAFAQGSLSEILPRLLSESVTMPSTTWARVPGNPHEGHFLPAAAQLTAPYALNGALVTQLSTFPLGSSSGGFTYSTDAKTGIPQRNSTNFGPAFAERALTNGKGRWSAGFSFQHVEFDRFEGQGLDGGVRFYLQHNDCCPGQTAGRDPWPVEPAGQEPLLRRRPRAHRSHLAGQDGHFRLLRELRHHGSHRPRGGRADRERRSDRVHRFHHHTPGHLGQPSHTLLRGSEPRPAGGLRVGDLERTR